VVADSSYSSPMGPPSDYGMTPNPMSGPPGQGSFGGSAGGYDAGAFGGPQYGAPASTYGMPTGVGGPAGAWAPMQQAYPQSNASHSTAPFDSRAAEAAFTSAGNAQTSSGPSNGNSYGQSYGGMDNGADPFAFLSSGLGSLSMNDDARRNGNSSNNKTQS
jgi:hypothetical protein